MTKDAAAATILLIRHGETAWNAEHRIQGNLDVPLSATGTWQAGRLAEFLRDERLDAIVASDLARAWMTAQPLAADRNLQVQPDPRLRERMFGVFEGKTLEQVAADHPQEFANWRARDPAWQIPGGESGHTFIARVLTAMREIAARFRGGRVAVVSHGGVLDVVYRHAHALAWDAPRTHAMLNAAVNRIEARCDPFALDVVDWGDVRHLGAARDEI